MTSKQNPSPDNSGRGRTPMLAQYLEVKAQHPEALLLFRMGDFFETFFEDAQILAQVTGVTLTSRDAKSPHPVPLAGVPHHALDSYLGKLLAAGLTVAICEQVEDPATAKGLVKREVVEIICPGTATGDQLVDSPSGRYCLAWVDSPGGANGWALLDATTGDFRCGQENADLEDLLQRYPVREIIVPEQHGDTDLHKLRRRLAPVVVNEVNGAWFHPEFARRTLLEHFQVTNLAPFGLEADDWEPAVAAGGALLRYLTSLVMKKPAQVLNLSFTPDGQGLLMDEETLRNLEVLRTFRGEKGQGTLVHHIDATATPMGRRLLEMRLARPDADLSSLEPWHSGIAVILEDYGAFAPVRGVLDGLGDMERLGAQVGSGKIGPAGMRRLGEILDRLMELRRLAREDEGLPSVPEGHPARVWLSGMADLRAVAGAILQTVAPDAPATQRKPGSILSGVDAELDRARAVATDSKGFLARLQEEERRSTGIPTLKVGFNKVFGYYFEVTNKHLERVPDHYQQKQTLVGSCRYHTEQLKETENAILAAEDTIAAREAEIFARLLALASQRLQDINQSARLVGQVDLMMGFAAIARQHDYRRPLLDDSLELNLREGRHPVIEQMLDDGFIPNDTNLDGDRNQILLLTGPNMGGKSTYLRQVALIVLMAQAGSFVPAESARIGLVDRIFTRVGASDNLARGESTFYTEMGETARILRSMSRRSLVILDEVGRGTSTYDGLSLAWAITEFLGHADGPRPRSIFATHYHELTDLEDDLSGLVNLCLEVKEWQGRIIFMHKVVPGRSDKSYGIHVARLAGVPEAVLQRADQILQSLTLADARDRPSRTPRSLQAAPDAISLDGARAQLSLFREEEKDALETLRGVDLERLSPLEAFMLLVRIRKQLDS